jgi:S-adenosyl methyltransferase
VASEDWMRPEPSGRAAAKIDTTTAHIARMYDYWLGGKDNYAADREAGDAAMRAYPELVSSVRANRAFLARTVRYLAAEEGIRQFLDIGTGLPSANNTHEVAQAAAQGARIVYVDSDPIVLAHARALLTSGPEGATAYIDADLRDTATILAGATATLDFSQPVAVMLVAVLHCIPDEGEPQRLVTELMGAVPPGSFLVISHPPSDMDTGLNQAASRMGPMMSDPVTLRSQAQVSSFFDGLDLLEPGLVPIQKWRPGSDLEAAAKAAMWGGVARKPAS